MSANNIRKRLEPRKQANIIRRVDTCQTCFSMLKMPLQWTKLKKLTTFKENEMTLQDVLNKVCNGMSDNKTRQKLNISRATFSNYRNGHTTPTDEILEKMIEMSGLNPVEVYMAAYAEKIANPIVAEAFRNQGHLAA